MITPEPSDIEIIDKKIKAALAGVHTTTIGRVEKVKNKTLDIQPVISKLVEGEQVDMPLLSDVPPVFMIGGNSHTKWPIAVGDYCLVILAERSYDKWWEGRDGDTPLELRMHDYSDGFALVGVNPKATALTIPDRIVQIGDTFFEGNHEHIGDIDHTGQRDQEGDQNITGDLHVDGDVTVTGNITCQGTISAANFTGLGGGALQSTVNIETTQQVVADTDVIGNGTSLDTHTHTDSMGGTTSEPN